MAPHCAASPASPLPLDWVDALETGVAVLDADHRYIIEQYETLRQRASQLTCPEFRESLRQMLEHCRRHFEREETLLRTADFPRLAAHIRAHRHIEQRFIQLYEQEESLRDSAVDAVNALRELLIDLLLRHDLDYKSHLLYSLGR